MPTSIYVFLKSLSFLCNDSYHPYRDLTDFQLDWSFGRISNAFNAIYVNIVDTKH